MSVDNIQTPKTQNRYLRSLLYPERYQASIPDTQSRRAIEKDIKVTDNYVNQVANASHLFLFVPHSRFNTAVLLHFVALPGAGFTYLRVVPVSQDLATSFELIREVSGAMWVEASTISSTNFTISGSLNAIKFDSLPPISSATFSDILAYAVEPGGCIENVPVTQGVRARMEACIDDDFRPPQAITNTTVGSTSVTQMTSENEFSNVTRLVQGGVAAGSAFSATPAASVTIFDTDAGIVPLSSLIPANYYGEIRGVLRLPIAITGAATTASVRLVIERDLADPVTYVPAAFTNVLGTWHIENATSLVGQHMAEIDFFVQSTIPYSRLYIDATVDAGTIGLGTLNTTSNMIDFIIEAPDKYTNGSMEPGSVIIATGINANQVLSIGGNINYQAVPNSILSRDIGTIKPVMHDQLEIDVAKNFTEGEGLGRFPYVMTMDQHREYVATGAYEAASMGENYHQYMSWSVKDALRNLWSGTRSGLNKLGHTFLPKAVGFIPGLNQTERQAILETGDTYLNDVLGDRGALDFGKSQWQSESRPGPVDNRRRLSRFQSMTGSTPHEKEEKEPKPSTNSTVVVPPVIPVPKKNSPVELNFLNEHPLTKASRPNVGTIQLINQYLVEQFDRCLLLALNEVKGVRPLSKYTNSVKKNLERSVNSEAGKASLMEFLLAHQNSTQLEILASRMAIIVLSKRERILERLSCLAEEKPVADPFALLVKANEGRYQSMAKKGESVTMSAEARNAILNGELRPISSELRRIAMYPVVDTVGTDHYVTAVAVSGAPYDSRPFIENDVITVLDERPSYDEYPTDSGTTLMIDSAFDSESSATIMRAFALAQPAVAGSPKIFFTHCNDKLVEGESKGLAAYAALVGMPSKFIYSGALKEDGSFNPIIGLPIKLGVSIQMDKLLIVTPTDTERRNIIEKFVGDFTVMGPSEVRLGIIPSGKERPLAACFVYNVTELMLATILLGSRGNEVAKIEAQRSLKEVPVNEIFPLVLAQKSTTGLKLVSKQGEKPDVVETSLFTPTEVAQIEEAVTNPKVKDKLRGLMQSYEQRMKSFEAATVAAVAYQNRSGKKKKKKAGKGPKVSELKVKATSQLKDMLAGLEV